MNISLKTDYTYTDFIAVAEIEEFLGFSSGWKSSTLPDMLDAARLWVENWADRSILSQVWTMKMDKFPDIIYLPKGKCTVCATITYTDTNGDSQTLTKDTDYYLHNNGDKPRLEAINSWPSTKDIKDAISFDFTAGYGAAAANVPNNISLATKLKAEEIYRGEIDNMNAICSLLSPYQLHFDYEGQ